MLFLGLTPQRLWPWQPAASPGARQHDGRAGVPAGGADGLPAALRDDATARTLSLSKLTFTHQMARLLLVEQLYRGVEIRRGSKYHRD